MTPFGAAVAAAYSDGMHNDFGQLFRMASGKIVHLFIRSTGHAVPGTVAMRTSTDNGTTWNQVNQVGSDVDVTAQVGGGVGFNNRLMAFYTRQATEGIHYLFSDDEGATWSFPVLMFPATPGQIVVANGLTRTGSRTLLLSFYNQPLVPPGTYTVSVSESDNNGVSWGDPATVVSITGAERYTESAVSWIGGKQVLCWIRDDRATGQPLRQFSSSDGGRTWMDMGYVPFDAPASNHISPASSLWVTPNGRVMVGLSWTNSDTVHVKVITADALAVFANVTGWATGTVIDVGAGHYASHITSNFSLPVLLLVFSKEVGAAADIHYAAQSLLSDFDVFDAAGGLNFVVTNAGALAKAQVDGSGVGAGALATAPHAGNPDLWVPLKINGIPGWLPWWHA
jgi:hypothetical protein